jgi:CHAD domain-containing protein
MAKKKASSAAGQARAGGTALPKRRTGKRKQPAATPTAPPPPPALVAWLDGQVETLRLNLPEAAEKLEGDAVHASRVATRRLKAGLDLLKPLLPKQPQKRVGRVGRAIRRALGPVRDLDVMAGHLAEIAGDGPHAVAANWLAECVRSRHAHAKAESALALNPAKLLGKLGGWMGVREQATLAAEAHGTVVSQALHESLDDFADHAAQLVGHRAAATEGSAAPVNPHELRIAGKRLRYTVEIAVAMQLGVDEGLARQLKKMQDALGTWHDYVVLVTAGMEAIAEKELAYFDPPLLRRVLALMDHCTLVADRELDDFTRLWTERGPQIVEAIHRAVPLSTNVAAPAADAPAEVTAAADVPDASTIAPAEATPANPTESAAADDAPHADAGSGGAAG